MDRRRVGILILPDVTEARLGHPQGTSPCEQLSCTAPATSASRHVPDARLIEPTDALVAVTRACICGSDLWPYKQMETERDRPPHGPRVHRRRRGRRRRRPHGQAGRPRRRPVRLVRRHLRLLPGRDCRPPASTAASGAAPSSTAARARRCASRRRTARSSSLPVGPDDALMPSLLTLSDVMGTGHHAALAAQGRPGQDRGRRRRRRGRPVRRASPPAGSAPSRSSCWAVIPTGSRWRGTFGATDVVSERGEEAIERVRELTGGLGAHSVLECVGHGAVDAHGAEHRPPGRRGRPRRRSPGRVDSGGAADVLQQRHHRRRPGAGARLHRGAAARRARRPDRAGSRVRPGDEPRRRARRLPRHRDQQLPPRPGDGSESSTTRSSLR